MPDGGSGRHWPWILAALMTVVIGANLALLYVATSDPSFAVEPNYYAKALLWDEKREQDRRNLELGWALTVQVAAGRGVDGQPQVVARLVDGSGAPIRDAAVRVDAFHNARASRIVSALFEGGGDGSYSAALPMRRPGLWEFRFEARRGEERFTETRTLELAWR